MSVLRCLALLGCLVLTACGVAAMAATKPTGDTRAWKTYQVQVDNRVVQFTIPPGESGEYPVFKIPQKLDLGGNDVFDEFGRGPYLLRRFWDYRSSRFKQVDGTMDAIIGVSRAWRPLLDDEALKAAVAEATRRFEERSGRVPEAQDRPMRYVPLTIGGHQWLRVVYRVSSDSYVTPLDDRHYLEVSVGYGGFTRQDWRADAQAAADAILHSIRIEPVR